MSLPKHFVCPEDYFREAAEFFKKYEYLFNFANTDILLSNVFEFINISTLDHEIFEKDFNLKSVRQNDDFLRKFFEDLQKFEVVYEAIGEIKCEENRKNTPLGPKKKHEIICLAKEIKEICDRIECEVVVDFGSGLGYLDQLICETTKLRVLGIECNTNHYIRAKKRQMKYHFESVQLVKYMQHTIEENSDRSIKDRLVEKFGHLSNFCITGLHACADLTVTGLKLFLKMDKAKALILMPCCYHKMAVEDGRFKNFPLSRCLRHVLEENRGLECMNVPFLRLAAQPPDRNDFLQDLVFNLLARGVLQLYARRHNCKVVRNKRKAVRTKVMNNNFYDYLQNATTGFSLIDEIQKTSKEIDFEEIETIWRETKHLKTRAAIFVLLQNYLQPAIENFVLFDRVVFLQENGFKNSYCKKVFNESVSPKCLALISLK